MFRKFNLRHCRESLRPAIPANERDFPPGDSGRGFGERAGIGVTATSLRRHRKNGCPFHPGRPSRKIAKIRL